MIFDTMKILENGPHLKAYAKLASLHNQKLCMLTWIGEHLHDVAWKPKSLSASLDAYEELKCCGLALVEKLQGQLVLVALTKEMGWEVTIETLDLDRGFIGVKAQKVKTFINSLSFFVLF